MDDATIDHNSVGSEGVDYAAMNRIAGFLSDMGTAKHVSDMSMGTLLMLRDMVGEELAQRESTPPVPSPDCPF